MGDTKECRQSSRGSALGGATLDSQLPTLNLQVCWTDADRSSETAGRAEHEGSKRNVKTADTLLDISQPARWMKRGKKLGIRIREIDHASAFLR
jgi:hypothetical protein